ncbi:MAG: ROK family protein [Cyanobacteria bacterium]|nr:ROK family protein [Cyanobacteriota bacterium]
MPLDQKIVTVGIDMGGTKIAACPFVNGQLVKDQELREPTPQNDAEAILQTMTNMIEELKKTNDIKAVGISTAGIVSNDGVMIGGCGNIKGWKGTKVKAELEKRLGITVEVENDANCAALAEATVGCAKNYDPVLLVIVGTGIGGGIIWGNKVWRGANYAGGEIGHIKLTDKKARRCTCGDWDCWEAYASGTGLQNTSHLFFADPEMDNYKLMDLHHKGDQTAIDVINQWHDYLALGMASVINTLDPEAVVVSGGMAQFINYTKLNKKVRDRVVDALKDKINILEGSMGNDSGMVGAACLANFAAQKNGMVRVDLFRKSILS